MTARVDQFVIKRGDTLPVIRRVLKFDDGTIQDLTASTSINFVYAPDDGGVPNTTLAVTRTASIVNAPGTDGLVEYPWIAADTAVVGDFLAEFEVLFGADRLTFPNGKRQYIQACVVQDVNE